MAWFRCGVQKTVDKTHIEDTDDTYQPTPTPTPIPIQSRSKPDRLFSHPIVPLGSKNYRGQYYYEVPVYDYTWDTNTQQYYLTSRMQDVTASSSYSGSNNYFNVTKTETFIPALGTVFSTLGVHTVTYICDIVQTSRRTGDNTTIHIHREVSQDIVVVDHGSVVVSATPDCPCDIYSDGYCFFRPVNIQDVWWNEHVLKRGNNILTRDIYNYVHYYPRQNQTVAVNKISCIPWRTFSLGTGCGEHSYTVDNNSWSSTNSWTSRWRDDSTPSQYNSFTAFLSGDGVTPIDISEFSIWSSFYWMRRIDTLFYNVGSVTNYQTLANWNVYGCSFLETFQNVGFTSDMFACIKDWNLKATIAMQAMFNGCTNITHTNFLANWDVSHCRNFSSFFYGCSSLTDLAGLSNWNVMGVYFSQMFYGCSSLIDLTPLRDWGNKYHNFVMYSQNPGSGSYNDYYEDGVLPNDIKCRSMDNVINNQGLYRMFGYCTNLTSLDGLQTLTYPYTPSTPDPTKTYQIESPSDSYQTSELFYHCINLTDISALANWRTSSFFGLSITYSYSSGGHWYSSSNSLRGPGSIFAECYSLTDISPLRNWNTSSWVCIGQLFSCCINLVDISPLEHWDLTSCQHLEAVFDNCYSIADFSPLGGWGSSLGSLITIGGMFYNCLISSFDFLSTWNTPNLKCIDYLFSGVRLSQNKNDLTGLEIFDRCRFSSMNSTFRFMEATNSGAYGIYYGGHTYKVINSLGTEVQYSLNWNGHYSGGLNSVSWNGSRLYTLHGIENWKVHQTVYMQGIFANNLFLYDISALSNWTTTNLTDASSMFQDDRWLSDISALSNWNTSQVISMNLTFSATSIEDIAPLAGWDKSKVEIYRTWISYRQEWEYHNAASGFVTAIARKGYSTSLGETVVVTSYYGDTECYAIRFSDNDTSHPVKLPLTDITFSTLEKRDASSASDWNFAIPSDYDKGLEVFPRSGLGGEMLQWNNVPSWN